MQIYAKFSNLVYKILKSRLQNSQISFTKFSNLIPVFLPDTPSGIPNGRMLLFIPNGRMLHVILTERSEWKDLLLFGSLLHRKRNEKPLMLSNTHSLPFPFRFFCPKLSS